MQVITSAVNVVHLGLALDDTLLDRLRSIAGNAVLAVKTAKSINCDLATNILTIIGGGLNAGAQTAANSSSAR